ncbi:TIGR03013 family XrtA/PEP-CTERM system glycosyltransferase [Zoogloea sp.]|jgi:sugar transferase (PEP-CTERM system associated)|uniref:TIGR03013 family XrtA/PEP-CTERM system glycosyltransferase n=1 Tax=Zoogloea sp. TaxID=49181 RepID=UPI001B734FD1|nr:TIGR03013 family XrtA/PEP-CTERM system glycosyltransferase [Zoogloea sp.]MBK7847853.1 TIGR03013 family PEP-CTERM/XrtA system glycosyltransferase [Zoogloea sp.]MBP7444734.1 TIGR03013 family PEP-CTERM/XrtA system glycosyltransferase [Zoogloea sp.]HPI59033.1 TIGR03013 family PEP-CTERM/XrtA system glycosyltransferase [Zoogloea sp.]
MLKLFNHYVPSSTVLQVLFDAMLLFFAVIAVFVLQSKVDGAVLATVVPSAFAFAVTMMILNGALGLYRVSFGGGVRETLMRVAMSIALSIPVAYGIFQVLPWGEFAHEAMELNVVALLGFVVVARGFAVRRVGAGVLVKRIMVIGTGADAVAVEHALTHSPSRGLQVVGFFPSGPGEEVRVDPKRIIHVEGSLLATANHLRVNEIIVALKERRGGVIPLRELLDCKMAGIKVLDLSSFFERVRGQVRIDSLRASWLIYGEGFRQGWSRTLVKRIFDIVASLILLILAAPVMVLAALLIVIEDGAPVFYRQERVGLGGRLFKVTKFRSMRRDAERDGKPRWASANDDRVTRIGRFIRKVRIDELPQLFNVLKGDMSLVGPRPERPFFVDQLTRDIPFYAVRHCVKPGVTGWAQVRYQYGSSVDDAINKLQYDLYYVKNHTLFLDTVVLFETVRVVLTGDGAH